MVGVILAAGIGSRLRPLTNDKPKCLIKVCGKTLLDYQLEGYRKAGIVNIYIVVGYEAEKVIDHCKHIKDLNIVFCENPDYESTNNMYSSSLLKKELAGKEFILNNADLAIEPNLISNIVESQHDDVIVVDVNTYDEESMKVTVNDKGVITDIAKTIERKYSLGRSLDHYKISSETSTKLFDIIHSYIVIRKDNKQWTEVALQEILNEGLATIYPLNSKGIKWVEVDNYDDLQRADLAFSDFGKDFDSLKAVFLDLDGTVFLGEEKIQDSEKFINWIRKKKKKVFFLSNNSSKNKADYVDKLANYDIKSTVSEIILSSDGLISFLKKNGIKSIYVVGTQSLKDSLVESGFELTEKNPEYVVLGYDTELNYEKLKTASSLMYEGVDLLATHCDVFCPTPKGPIPDIGSMTEMLRMTTGKEPVRVFGKPNKSMIEHKLEELGINSNEAVVIGDRMYTDIELAKNADTKSILVLSGETTRDDLAYSECAPDLCIGKISDIINAY